MAHPRTVAVRRQIADQRLRKATEAAAACFGVPFKQPATFAHRHPDLHSAELIENVAEFLEQITTAARPERKAS